MTEPNETDLIREEARVWHAQLSSGHATGEDRAAFEAWRSADPRCAAAAEELALLHAAMMADPAVAAMIAPDVGPEPSVVPGRGDAGRRWRWLALPAGGVLATAVLAALLIFANVGPGAAPERATAIAYEAGGAQTRLLELDDGSVVRLGAGSRVEVAYAADRRLVRLTAGEAAFAVAKDKARPFVVVAGNTSVRAVGTRFHVRLAAREVRVDVEEGVVEVFKPASTSSGIERAVDARPVTLRAGEQVVAMVATGAIALPTRALPPSVPARTAPVAVASGNERLRYVGAPLAALVADATARGEDIRIASPEIGAMTLTTSFRASEIDTVIDNLPDVLPVAVERGADGSVVIRARD